MLGLGDNVGSGFPIMLSACKSENWRKPALQENLELQEVELHLWMVSLLPQEVIDFLKGHLGNRYEELSSNEQIVLATACLEKEVSNIRLQTILDLHPTDIGELLATMTDKKKLLKKNYKGRWTTYTLNIDTLSDDLPLFTHGQQDNPTVNPTVNPIVKKNILRLLALLDSEKGTGELLALIGIKDRKDLHKRFISPSLTNGFIAKTIEDNKHSRLQKYRLTEKGRAFLKLNEGDEG